MRQRIKRRTASNYNVYTDGLKIYTTINSHMQQYAEDAVRRTFEATSCNLCSLKKKQGSKNAPYARCIAAGAGGRIADQSHEANRTLSCNEVGGCFWTGDSAKHSILLRKCLFSLGQVEQGHDYDSDGFYPLLQVTSSYRIHVDGPDERICEGLSSADRIIHISNMTWQWWDAVR